MIKALANAQQIKLRFNTPTLIEYSVSSIPVFQTNVKANSSEGVIICHIRSFKEWRLALKIFAGAFLTPWDPVTCKSAAVMISKESFVLRHVIIIAYCPFCFVYKIVTLSPRSTARTSGVKVPCATSIIRCKYAPFSFSCCLDIFSVLLFGFVIEFTCVTRISKNSFYP